MEWYQYLLIGAIGLYFIGGSLWTLNMQLHIYKCLRFKTCSDRTCKYHNFCDAYHETITPEEAEELLKILEEHGKEKEVES